MIRHLTSNLWLLLITVVLCCVVYPAVLWGFGQLVLPYQAQGSLVQDADGQTVGSLIIAQPFTDDGYFWPRPSAVSYNAGASGASNYGANNPALRTRVAKAVGTVVKYRGGPKKGQLVAPDVEAWFKAQWAKDHPNEPESKEEDLPKAKFESWLAAHPQADLEPVPADMVMTSGSGLDPHITLKNAQYQLDRVASTWADRLKRKPEDVRQEVEELLKQKASAPLAGLAGVQMVNVLEVNLELKKNYKDKVGSGG